MQQNPSPNHHLVLNRRQLLTTALGTAATTTLFPGLATAGSDNDIEQFTDAQINELETIFTGVFGQDKPLPLGITIDKPDDDGWYFPSFDALSLGSTDETTDTEDEPTIVDCAHTLCAHKYLDVVDDIGEAAEEAANVKSDFNRQSFRAQHLLAILVEQGMVNTLSPDDIISVREQLPDATRFLPLIGSFNNVMQTACDVDETKPQTVIDFYIAVAAFIVEVALFKFAIGYNVAFKGTHVLATRTTVARLLQAASPRTHGLILSEVHWAIREGTSKGAGVVASNTLPFVYETTQRLKAAAPQDGIEGTPTQISITRRDLEVLDLFNCSPTESKGDLLGWLFGDEPRDADEVSDRMKTIVKECGTEDQDLFPW